MARRDPFENLVKEAGRIAIQVASGDQRLAETITLGFRQPLQSK